MKLTICYLGVLTVLCLLPPIFTTLGLFSKHWIRYSSEISKTIQTESIPVLKSTVNQGLFKTSQCTKSYTEGIPSVCQDLDNSEFVSILDWVKTQLEANATDDQKRVLQSYGVYTEFLHKLQRTLRSMEVLTIIGLALELGGVLLAMTFWMRSLDCFGRIRWLLCAVCWFASGILVATVTFWGIPLNKEQKDQLQLFSNADKTAHTEISTQTAWALLLSGVGSFHAFVAGVFVLMARCFTVPNHKYSPISLVTYEKAHLKGTADREMLLGQDEGEEEEKARIQLQAEYHD